MINTESIPKTMPTINDYRTKTFTISYQKQEAEKVMGMENELMEYFWYNRSQLHKTLVRDAYRKLRMLWKIKWMFWLKRLIISTRR